jgi:hypothetical protein
VNRVKTYVRATALVFGGIMLAHAARVYAEGARTLREPSFLVTTALAVGLFGWSMSLLRRQR